MPDIGSGLSGFGQQIGDMLGGLLGTSQDALSDLPEADDLSELDGPDDLDDMGDDDAANVDQDADPEPEDDENDGNENNDTEDDGAATERETDSTEAEPVCDPAPKGPPADPPHRQNPFRSWTRLRLQYRCHRRPRRQSLFPLRRRRARSPRTNCRRWGSDSRSAHAESEEEVASAP